MLLIKIPLLRLVIGNDVEFAKACKPAPDSWPVNYPSPKLGKVRAIHQLRLGGLSSAVHISHQQGIKEISLVGESWTNKGYKLANEGYLIDKQGISWNSHRIFDPNRGYNQVRPQKRKRKGVAKLTVRKLNSGLGTRGL